MKSIFLRATSINKILFPVLAFLLCACTSQSIYKPAKGAGFGYTEKVLGENYYQVQFKAFGEGKATDYAILRAAELTNEKGYDWFVIVKNDIQIEEEKGPFPKDIGRRETVTQNCGLLGCRTTVNSSSALGVDNTNLHSVNATTSILDIRLGKGIRPSSSESNKSGNQKNINESYDALETIEKIKAKLK